MIENNKTYKLCFYCDCVVVENNRIVINSIGHTGLIYNINFKFKNKLKIVGDTSAYELNLIHLSCCEKIAFDLGFEKGQWWNAFKN